MNVKLLYLLLFSICLSSCGDSSSVENYPNANKQVKIEITEYEQSIESSVLSTLMGAFNLQVDSPINLIIRDLFKTAAFAVTQVKEDRIEKIANVDTLIFDKDVTRKKAIIYLHGGGYAYRYFAGHVELADRLKKDNNARVFLPDYAVYDDGKTPYPIARDQMYAFYKALTQHEDPQQRYAPEDIIFAGDSAGAHLAVDVMLKLRDSGDSMPAGVVLYSPWLDLRHSSPSHVDNAETDITLSPELLNRFARDYFTSAGIPLSDPSLSLVLANYDNFPPVLLFTSVDEIIEDDAQLLYEALTRSDRSVTYYSYSVPNGLLLHAWPAFLLSGDVVTSTINHSNAFIQKLLN